ncbi:MAG: AAA family ATPase [Deltaproteobacteria bacterium]|nr:AAA family ATPase [Deltaproteobacteria bacterium]
MRRGDDSRQIAFPPFRLDVEARTLRRGEDAVALRPRTFDMLVCLVARPGQVISREELRAEAWKGVQVVDQVFRRSLLELRAALGDAHEAPRFIETVRGRGFRFIAPLVPAAGTSGAEPELVGRESELELLANGVAQSQRGYGQFFLITGEAGIGKTALCDAAVRQARHRHGPIRLRVARAPCAAGAEREAYAPVLALFGDLLRQCDRSLCRRALASAPAWAPLLAELADGAVAAFEPTTAHRMAQDGLALIATLAADRPLLIAIDDLQWADRASQDILARLARRLQNLPVALLVTCRDPGSAVDLLGQFRDVCRRSDATELALAALGDGDQRDLLTRAFDAAAARQLQPRLAARGGGSPLLLTLLVEHWKRSGIVSRVDGGWAVDAERLAADPPPARLATLVDHWLRAIAAEDVALLEAVSVCQPQATTPLLAACLGVALAEVEARCRSVAMQTPFLRAARDGESVGAAADQCWELRHPLYRECLYQRLPASRRAELHARAGAALERHGASPGADTALQTARHFERAGRSDRAIASFETAALHAIRRHAHREAADLVATAIGLIDRQPPAQVDRAQDARLSSMLGYLDTVCSGFASSGARAAHERALRGYESIGDLHGTARALISLAAHSRNRGDFIAMDSISRRALQLTETAVPDLLPNALAMRGTLALFTAELATALEVLERGLGLEVAPGMPGIIDITVTYFAALGLTNTVAGRIAAARAWRQRSIARALECGGSVHLLYALPLAAIGALFEGDLAQARAAVDQGEALQQQFGFASFDLTLRWLRDMTEREIDGVTERIARHGVAGSRMGESIAYVVLAEACLAAGRLDEARAALAGASTSARARNERVGEAEHLRIEGELALARADASAVADAAARFAAAFELAERQGAGLWALKAATALARLPGAARNAGRERLAAVLHRLRDEPSCPVLDAARAVLAQARAGRSTLRAVKR